MQTFCPHYDTTQTIGTLTLTQELLPRIQRRYDGSLEDTLLSASIAYLFRLCNMCYFDIGYIPPHTDIDQGCTPLRVELDSSWSFAYAHQMIQQRLSSLATSPPDPHTLVAYPFPFLTARDRRQPAEHNPLQALAIAHNPENTEAYTPHPDNILTILITHQSLTWCYHTDRLDTPTATRLFHHFETFLSNLVEPPEKPLKDIALLTQAEYNQITKEWNQTQADIPTTQCIHQLIETQAHKTPNAIAVVQGSRQLTYRQLDERANQLAHLLQHHRVAPEALVGICMDRSLEMMVALLATLKAGGAYLPLNPEYPRERLAVLLEESQPVAVITQPSYEHELPNNTPVTIVLEETWQAIEQEPTHTPPCAVTQDNLAYIIFTSGSTGRPKAVMVPHRAVLNHNLAIIKHYNIHSKDHALQFASISFDVSLEEILPTLICGATLILRPEALLTPTHEFHTFIIEHDITILNIPTSYWHQWVVELETHHTSIPSNLRLVIVGGEKALPDYLAIWQTHSQVIWMNAYGIAEATITSTIYTPPPTSPAPLQFASVPIGKPIDNTQTYILDDNLNPVPVGIPGELYIGGMGVSSGYLNRPELTAEKFISDPFSEHNHTYLHKTGDLARYMPDGTIEFLGRIDHQIKIRGYRIEPGEIESLLHQHAAVREAAVVVRNIRQNVYRLVAYILINDQAALVQEGTSELELKRTLRQHLQHHLPDYMVPAAFIFMDTFPMTVHNKIDLRALPTPTKFMTESDEAYAPPQTQLEEELTVIWSQTLRVEPVGIHDTFYALGGESLLAIQIISQIANQLAVTVPLRIFLETKTIANLAEYISQVQQTDEPLPTHYPPLHPAERTDLIPTTGTQESVWFIHQIQPNNLAYNSPAALRLTGSLDVPALERSINALVKRHESLRTTFAAHDGKPIQVIHPEIHITLGTTDLSHIAADEREAKAHELLTTIVQQPFDLTQAPLIRCHLLRLTTEDHILILNIHHAVTDGWSYGIFYRELAECYAAYITHRQPILPRLPVQLADYAYWQRAFLQSDTVKKQLDYWKQHLADSPSLLQLPTDYPRQPIQQLNGSVVRQAISPHTLELLKRINQEEQATLFMAFLAVYAILLARTTGQTDILIGSPVVERDQDEVQNIIGFLVNNLVFRINLDATPTYRELLHQVRTTALDAYSNRDVPFERIVEALQPERDLSYHPVFQVALAMELEPLAGLQLHNVYGAHLEMNSGGSWFDISVLIEERSSGLVAAWEYDTDLFDEATIRRMAQHFEQLLASAASNPDKPVFHLPMLTEKERSLILTEWNNTQTPYPDTLCIHQLVEQQVQRTPDNIAVIFQDTSLTYRQLDERSNQLAHYLQQLGVQPETIVAIAVERSLDMIIGLLGILKAGGAYLPLDPTYPKDRLAFMLDDAEVGILITQDHLRSQLPSPADHTICLDTDWQHITTFPTTPPICHATPDSLVYIIYTSGSTGKPKGALVEHRMLVNLITGIQQRPGINKQDTLLAVTTLSFDTAMADMYLPLTTGARLVIASQETVVDGNQLTARIAETKTTWMQATPATWRLLLDAGWQGSPDMLIISTGEALSWELAQQLLPRCNQLWDLYGPTETTIWTIGTPITSNDRRITIGYPLPNVKTYILDSTLQPVPIGVTGELYIGGAGVVRGYLNRPELTANRFLTNPFSDDCHNRFYRTGDLARYLADGKIEYLRRVDHQVKIRGFRIELGEIETLLSQHPLVQEALVLAREDHTGDTRLVAYILTQATAEHEQAIVKNLRRYLETKIPGYMLPATYMLLDAFPLTPNGKVDRKALPAPDTSRRLVEQAYTPPRTPMEETLVALWQDILGLDQVGIHDNFFHLGGHSLQVMQLVSRITSTHNVPLLRVRDMFQYPTIASLGEMLEHLPQQETPPTIPTEQPKPTPKSSDDVVRMLTTESLTIEQRPMLTLFATGKIQPVDAAALSYLPPGDLPFSFPEDDSPITQEEIIHDWYDDQVVFDECYETHLGSIANISLPLFGNQLYHDKQQTIQRIHESLVLAKFLGARIVALTGLIPSATNFGRDLLPLLAEHPDLPAITTGHATTTSAVVLTIERLLEESNRTASNECVGFLGLGSIGLATLRLMIAVLPHPRKLLLCDLYSKRQELETIVKELREQANYTGEVHILESTGKVPAPFYAATLIVGATNMPDVLEVDQLAPGTLIVDDSAPHCFNPDQARRRFEQQYDILFTEGGALQTPQTVLATKYYPRRAQQMLPSPYRETFVRHIPDILMGCTFSGLLSTRYPHLSPTTGYIERDKSVQHYTILQQIHYRGARLHCEHYTLPETLVAQFRHHYGGDTK